MPRRGGGVKAESQHNIRPFTPQSAALTAPLKGSLLSKLLALGCLTGTDAQLGDLVPVTGSDVSLGADPGTADGVDEGSVDELLDVVVVDAAGGQELQTDEGTGQVLQSVQTAVDVGGEELDHLQAMLQSAHDLGGGDAAGSDSDAVGDTVAHDLIGEAGRNDELGAHLDGQLALVQVDDGAGADQNVGAVLGNSLDALGSAGGAEGDLHGVNAAGGHSLCGGDGVLNLVQNDNGDDDGVGESFHYSQNNQPP